MKRIEAVITPWALDVFKEAAPRLGISAFDIVQVYRSGCALAEGRQRLYRGCEFTADLPRLRLEFVLFDDDVQTTLHQLLELVHPESIAIFRLDQTILPAKGHFNDAPPLRETKTDRGEAPTRQLIGSLPGHGGKESDISSDVSLRPAADGGDRSHYRG